MLWAKFAINLLHPKEAQIVTAEFSESLENDTAIVSEGMLEWCDVWAFGVS